MFLKTCHCPASVALAFSFVNPIFLCLFGTFYVNESKLILFRSKQMLFFSSYLRIQFFELYFSCKEGLLYTLTYVRQILRNMDGISSHSLCHNGIIL